jgi:hypothetical protein
MEAYFYEKINMNKPNSKSGEQNYLYLTIIEPCVFCAMVQVGKLWKGQPAGEENNDTPLHAASRAGNKVE